MSNLLYLVVNRVRILFEDAQRHRLIARLKSCGQNVTLYMPVRIDDAEKVEIGDNVGIASFVHMWGGGGIKIGNRVMIGAHTAIASQGHDSNKEIMFGTVTMAPVLIEDDADIGTHCVILPGVTIGKGAVIGAGTVVNMNVKPFTIVVTGRERQEWPRRFVGRLREAGGKPTGEMSNEHK